MKPSDDPAPDPHHLGELERLAGIALDCVHREYPNHLVHLLNEDGDAAPARALHPAFYGCFDWHSAVHGHWCLARLARAAPSAGFVPRARAALERSLTSANLEAERRYLEAPGREGFERPYGLAWLLQLGAELREWGEGDAARWSGALEPLESLATRRFLDWLPRLPWPNRSGEHGQTAFALGLALDWARHADHRALAALIEARARDFYLGDRSAPIAYEPSGHDFLSGILAEIDLLRRVLPPAELASWLDGLLPGPWAEGMDRWLTPVSSPDPADGKLSHLDGLNLSRAWMLEGIAGALPAGDARMPTLSRAARAHGEAGLRSVTGEHYAGAHWLASFAAYYLTGHGRS